MEVANLCAVMDTLIDQDALISALLKSVSIKYLEQDVTCLNERVFIKTVYLLLTGILPAMICRLKPIGLQAQQSEFKGLLCNPMKILLNK